MLWRDMGLIMETAELTDLGVILHDGGVHGPGSYENINPARMMVLLQGIVLHEGMDLRSLAAEDREQIVASFQRVGQVILDAD